MEPVALLFVWWAAFFVFDFFLLYFLLLLLRGRWAGWLNRIESGLFFVCVYRMMSAILNVFIGRFFLYLVLLLGGRWTGWLSRREPVAIFVCLTDERLYCDNWLFFTLFVVVVEKTMSWLVEQDGARIFLPLSNVCQRWNEKQSAKLTRTIAVLCFFCFSVAKTITFHCMKYFPTKIPPIPLSW